MKNGYIKIARKLFDSEIWTAEPFTMGQAWVDLIAMANYATKDHFYRGAMQRVNRGQIATSETKLSARWKWGRRKVNTFLKNLEKAEMCTVNRTTRGTMITIENYAVYQDSAQQNAQQKNNSRTANAQQTHTKEESKKVNKENPPKGGPMAPPTAGEVAAYCEASGLQVDAQRFVDYYEAVGWTIAGEQIKSWQALCRRWNGTEDYGKPKAASQTFDNRMAKARRLLEEGLYDT